jgi:hypothetical protein
MDFGDALRAMKMGYVVKRKAWNRGKLRYWSLRPSKLEMIVEGVFPNWLPYLPATNDVLAEDWERVTDD